MKKREASLMKWIQSSSHKGPSGLITATVIENGKYRIHKLAQRVRVRRCEFFVICLTGIAKLLRMRSWHMTLIHLVLGASAFTILCNGTIWNDGAPNVPESLLFKWFLFTNNYVIRCDNMFSVRRTINIDSDKLEREKKTEISSRKRRNIWIHHT